ncbi:MAG TPA: Ig-like domain-containing protein, partial [Blastocatellia bacterium]|nr:Ig-like domain-containing protein [Blastocatellia bacterium]
MRMKVVSLALVFASAAYLVISPSVSAGQGNGVKTVEITPATADAEVGQQIKFTAVGKDASGKIVEQKASVWIAVPSDVAVADESGVATFYQPGRARIGAILGNKVAYATVIIKPARVARIDIEPPGSPLVVKGGAMLLATPRISNGNPRSDVTVNWSSENPDIATVDAAGVVVGLKPGTTTIRAEADGGSGTISVNVIANPVSSLTIEPRSITARTGDVVRFGPRAKDTSGNPVSNPFVRWSISGEGAMIEPDGAFVTEKPGTYVVTATSGEQSAVASVVVSPRNIEREVEIVGRAPFTEFQASEQWIFGKYAYVSTISDRLLTYDISDPSKPKLTHTVKFDARILNDFSTTADGRIGVISREGASNRRNGIAFLDMSDPARPKVISEYTETVTGGVHSAFVDGHYVYLTDDATGSMRVIDFKDVKNPKEVARWEVPNPLAKPVRTIDGETVGGRYLHDVQVVDGLAYLAYWRDGLVILDVGNGIKGGRPERPQLVSQYRFNHNELYGSGWIAGTHAVFRYKDYVFVG